MATGAGIVRGDSHQPVDPTLGAQISVSVFPADLDSRALDARFISRQVLGKLGLEAFAFAVAQVHTKDHPGPVLGLGSAGAGVDAQGRVVGVMLTGEHPGELHLIDQLDQIGKHPVDLDESLLVFALFAELDQDLGVFQLLSGRVAILDDLLQHGPLFQQLLCFLPLVPEIGVGNFRFQFLNSFTLGIDVKDTSRVLRVFPAAL